MRKYQQMKHAFTLLEMVFVITILGVVAGISSEVIARTYESYINQKALYRSSIKTELAATLIANRLAYAIPGSIVARTGGNLLGISNILPGANHNALEWIGYDVDGFTTRNAGVDNGINRRPGWSGFADLSATARTGNNVSPIDVSTPGSNLALSNAIIATLSAGGTARTLAGSALYFPLERPLHNNINAYAQAGAVDGIYSINAANPMPDNQTIRINAPLANPNTTIKEHYKLAWTAYSVQLVATGGGNFDLFLNYNYQPWNGETYNGNVRQQRLLLTNVSVFRFTGSGNSVRFKLCQRERTGGTDANPVYISVCKEKVVIR